MQPVVVTIMARRVKSQISSYLFARPLLLMTQHLIPRDPFVVDSAPGYLRSVKALQARAGIIKHGESRQGGAQVSESR